MKKFLIILIALLIIATAAIYILIPEKIIVNRIVYTNLKVPAVARCLHDDTKRINWFPGKQDGNDFLYDGKLFSFDKKEYNANNVSIKFNNENYASEINSIPVSPDSSAIQWRCEIVSGNNPLKKIIAYNTAKTLQKDMDFSLNQFKNFIQESKNIYCFNIQFATLTDTALVSIKINAQTYPSTTLIYSLVDELKKYIADNGATVHNYPMINITQSNNGYELMVGLPTNILLNGNNRILPKRMVMLKDKTLITEVKGGDSTIKKALQATNNFMDDNRLSTPVIPFQQLITDRRNITDTTKWITKIFTPII